MCIVTTKETGRTRTTMKWSCKPDGRGVSAEWFEDTHPGSQIHLRGQNYRLLEWIRGKIQQKNRTHNLILSNLSKSIVQTILIGVVYSISALSSPWHSRSNDNIKVYIFDRLTCLVAQFGRANCYLRWHVVTSSDRLSSQVTHSAPKSDRRPKKPTSEPVRTDVKKQHTKRITTTMAAPSLLSTPPILGRYVSADDEWGHHGSAGSKPIACWYYKINTGKWEITPTTGIATTIRLAD